MSGRSPEAGPDRGAPAGYLSSGLRAGRMTGSCRAEGEGPWGAFQPFHTIQGGIT
jgi:hypothetical protein